MQSMFDRPQQANKFSGGCPAFLYRRVFRLETFQSRGEIYLLITESRVESKVISWVKKVFLTKISETLP